MSNVINLEKATAMTRRFREHREAVLNEHAQGRNILALSETYDRAAFDQLLAQPGCVKVRIYYGMDDDRKVHAIIVGVDGQDRDILHLPRMSASAEGKDGPVAASETTTDPGTIIEEGSRCPPICPGTSELGGDPGAGG